VVLGYILAGAISGPHTPPLPLIANKDTIQRFQGWVSSFSFFRSARVRLPKLKQARATAFIGAIPAILVMLCAGYSLAQFAKMLPAV